MSHILRLPRNTAGRDFVVGDVHGYTDALARLMAFVDFDPKADRLICVGDLIDRGPDSWVAFSMLKSPFVYSVRGNHEQMAIDSVQGERKEVLHVMNGGTWFYSDFDAEQRQQMINFLDQLPYVIEVDTPLGHVGILHAECLQYNWSEYLSLVEQGDDRILTQTLWGRTRISYDINAPVDEISKIYVGHSVVREPTIRGNTHYIDTGSFLPHGKLTMYNLMDGSMVQYVMATRMCS